jgi:hypothetical protein
MLAPAVARAGHYRFLPRPQAPAHPPVPCIGPPDRTCRRAANWLQG